jgi:hypothetical protein
MLLAFGLTFIAFLPVLGHDFVNWDDNLNFLANTGYRGLSAENIRWMFTTFHMGPYQPLSWLTLGLDYTLWGMDARGYHLTSLLLHAFSAGLFVLVAVTLYRLSAGRDYPAGAAPAVPPSGSHLILAGVAAALFFGIHPQRAESVAWVTERRDVVSGLFLLLAILAYLLGVAAGRHEHPARGRYQVLALAAFVASLLGKATAVTLPLVLLVLDVYPLRRFRGGPRRAFAPENRHLLMEKLPWLAIAAVFGVVALVGQGRSGALQSVEAFGPADRVALTFYAAGFYLCKMVRPMGLSPLYEWTPAFRALAPPSIFFVLLTPVLALVLFLARKRWPAGLAALVAYLVLVVPVSGVARAGHQLAADRYTYLATMPWALVFGGALLLRRESLARWSRPACIAVLAVLGVLTFAQSRIWRDSVALWTHAARVDPSSDQAAMNLASAYVDARKLNEAAAIYRSRLAADPGHGDARYSLGMVYYLAGQNAEAEAEFQRLVTEQPSFPMGHYGLGVLYMDQKRNEVARQEFETALRLEPKLVKARQALAQLGNP